MEYLAAVKLNSSKTCFVDFSQSLLKLWKNEIERVQSVLHKTRISVPLYVKCPSGEFVTSWSGKTPPARSDDDFIIYIDREFASHYNIEDGSTVQIHFISEHLHAAKQVTVCPCRKTDWEILELNSCHIENVLLDHISVVKVGQVFPVHLSSSTVVLLKTLSTDPQDVVLLQEYTEVVVAPFGYQQQQNAEKDFIPQVENKEKYTNQEYTYLFKPTPENCSDSFAISKVVKCLNELLGSREDENNEKCEGSNVNKQYNNPDEGTDCKWELDIQQLPEELCSDTCRKSFTSSSLNTEVSTASKSLDNIPSNSNKGSSESVSNADDHAVSFQMKSSFPPYQGFVCETIFKKCFLDQMEGPSYFEVELKNTNTGNVDTESSDGVVDVDNEANVTEIKEKEEKILLQVKVLPFDVWKSFFSFAPINTIFVNPFVLLQLQYNGTSKASINHYKDPIDEIQGIVLHIQPFQTLTDTLKKKMESDFCSVLKKWIDMGENVIINQGTLFTFQVDGACKHAVAEIIGVGNKICGKINQSNFDDLFVHIDADEIEDINVSVQAEKNYYDFRDVTSDIIRHIKSGFIVMNEHDRRTSLLQDQPVLLLYGKSSASSNGCGKTLISHFVADHFASHPYFCHIEYVECVALRGKQVNAISKCWETAFQNAFLKEPAVIVFDDLDQLISNVDLLQDGYQRNVYSERLGDLFRSLIKILHSGNKKVFVIGTSSSLESIHPSILPERNSHLFTKYVSLSSLPVDQIDLLKWYINKCKDNNGLNIKSNVITSQIISQKLTNYNIKNISSLATRTLETKFGKLFSEDIILKSDSKNVNSTSDTNTNLESVDTDVSSNDIESNIETFGQIMMNNLDTHKPKAIRWHDIGGLETVKETLKETLLWPAMYPELLSHCPLRLCSGVLLYGAPGTAKTMLATAVSYESNLNFISVKGPELLSKYIGSSEGNVRDLFARAEAAKPCIVFFDELESIAPRRGHDNTGVTDRVVNQLLTQLDGVESLDGVFVLAATSRPDLIDPALLRPGRFDKSIHCPMPTEEEREEILAILVKSVSVDADIDLKLLSSCTPGFSGADLKALVFNAQVESAHEFLDTLKDNEDSAEYQSKDCVDVTMLHFKKALETTKPSVSIGEKQRYQQVYSSFKSQGGEGESAKRDQKVTLA